MENYAYFSAVYDEFMDNIPYDDWCDYIIKILEANGIENGLCLELGCGTGEVCERLSKAGFDMIGLDNSEEMLDIAMEKRLKSGSDILYLLQDMTEFELYGTVRAIVGICDSLNYICDYEDLLKVFKLVKNYLDPEGIFVFDLNTVKKYKEIGDSTIAENREDASFIWENSYFEEEKINQYDLTLFIKDEDGKYNKHIETHIQKAYDFDEIKGALKNAGLEFIGCYKAFENIEINNNDEMNENDRVYFVAGKGE